MLRSRVSTGGALRSFALRGLVVVVPVALLVVVVVVALGLAFLALAMPNDAEGRAFADPQVSALAISGDEVLRLGFHGLARALPNHAGGQQCGGNDGSEHGGDQLM